MHPCTHVRWFLCWMLPAGVLTGSSDTSPTILIPVLVVCLTWNFGNITLAYCNFGSKEGPADRSFRVKTALWATTMLYFQPALWCPLQSASLCFMDPEPFRKFLSSTKVFASGAELFVVAGLPGRLKTLLCSAWNYVGTQRLHICFLNFCLNMPSNRLAGSPLDGTLLCNRRHIICICFYI